MRTESILLIFLAAPFWAGCTRSDAEPRTVVYGEAQTQVAELDIAAFFKNLDSLDGKRVRVKGMVTDVCEERGCWIRIGAQNSPRSVKFKVPDGVIVFPMSAKGKNVVAEGTVVRKTLSLEDSLAYLKHEAEEHKTDFDPASVKEPYTLIMLKGHGARISDRR